jgi:hypothetical protein
MNQTTHTPVIIIASMLEQYIAAVTGKRINIKLPLTTEREIELFEQAIQSLEI